jgi:hypothetical protein
MTWSRQSGGGGAGAAQARAQTAASITTIALWHLFILCMPAPFDAAQRPCSIARACAVTVLP